jgi:hypothetical protein
MHIRFTMHGWLRENKVSAFCGSVIADQVVLWPCIFPRIYEFASACISSNLEARISICRAVDR